MNKNKSPLISLILPIRNESSYILRALESISSQDYPHHNMEVIISDGMSEDNTREIVRDFASQNHLFPVNVIDNPERIVPNGLNRAILLAKGDILVRVDGHCEIAPDYIRQCVEALANHNVDGVGGPIETIGADGLSRVIAFAMGSKFGVGGSAFRTIDDQEIFVDTVAFPAYPRETIEKNGLFDEELVRNQDDEYNFRIRKSGGKILLTPKIRSKYYNRSTLGKLWRQYFQYGFWKVRVLQKHPRQMSLRQFIPPIFVLAVIVAIIASPILLLPLFALISLYLTANLFASGFAARKLGRVTIYLPLVYAALHFAYGTGFLIGLIRFAHRWGDRIGSTRNFSI